MQPYSEDRLQHLDKPLTDKGCERLLLYQCGIRRFPLHILLYTRVVSSNGYYPGIGCVDEFGIEILICPQAYSVLL